MRGIFTFVFSCIVLVGHATAQQEEDPNAGRKAELKKLQELSEAALLKKFMDTPLEWNDRSDNEKVTVEMMLIEMVRRGGAGFEQAIVEKMRLQQKAVEAWKKKEAEADKQREKGIQIKPRDEQHPDEENLPMLMALRRLQKKPEPVEIAVKQLDVAPTTRELPEFLVELRNVDGEKQSFHFAFGGDYRSGREARWAFEVRDAQGKLLAPRSWEAMMGGGMFQSGDLKHGKCWTTTLPLGKYVTIKEPGEYTARVNYHNTATIADFPAAPGLMLCSSKPFKFTVGKPVPRKVFVQSGCVEKTKSLVAALKGKTKVRMVYGKYDEKFHQFIEPTSPEGQLHQMGWSAVPGFLELMKDETITKEQRAWVFALMSTVVQVDEMSYHDRQWDGVIGVYESRFTGGYSSGKGHIDVQVQKRFASEWNKLAPELWEFVIDDAGFEAARLLEGRWVMDQGTQDGKPLLEKKDDVILLEVRQGTIEWIYRTRSDNITGSDDTVTKVKYLISASAKPQAIDFDIKQGKDSGKKRLGIFKFERDQLVLCLAAAGEKRPADFTEMPGSRQTLSVWKRNPW